MDTITSSLVAAQKTYAQLEPALRRLRSAGIERTWENHTLLCSRPGQYTSPGTPLLDDIVRDHPLGFRGVLYVHIPYCEEACRFCPYVMTVAKNSADLYLSALDNELRRYKEKFGVLEAAHLYVGGGTPSSLSPHQIERLFHIISSSASILPDAEVTFEVSPASLLCFDGDQKLDALKENGVTRISMGIQSFHPGVLSFAGRGRTEMYNYTLVETIKRKGFPNVNIDLIYGLPFQTLEFFANDLVCVSQLDPSSITTYHLRLDGSSFRKSYDDPTKRIYFPAIYPSTVTMKILATQFLTTLRYAESLTDWFHKPNGMHIAQHEKWHNGMSLLGVGVSAYSVLDSGWTFQNTPSLQKYLDIWNKGSSVLASGRKLSSAEDMRRFARLALKTCISRSVFQQKYHLDVIAAFPSLLELQNLGVVMIDSQSVMLTPLGNLFAEEVAEKI